MSFEDRTEIGWFFRLVSIFFDIFCLVFLFGEQIPILTDMDWYCGTFPHEKR